MVSQTNTAVTMSLKNKQKNLTINKDYMIKLKNLLNENEESDKRFAEYIYKSYL